MLGDNRMRVIVGVLVALLWAGSAAATPVTLSCDTKGDAREWLGRLVVVVDLAHLLVVIRAPEVLPKVRWEYQDGRKAPLAVQGQRGPWDDKPVAQFVRLTASSLEMGYREPDGELLHVAHIDRAALTGGRCRWRTSDEFGLS
jgi:hypothetical protein